MDTDVEQYSYAQLDSLIKLDVEDEKILEYCQLRLDKSIAEKNREEEVYSNFRFFRHFIFDERSVPYIDRAVVIADELEDPLLQFQCYRRKTYHGLGLDDYSNMHYYLKKAKHFAKVLDAETPNDIDHYLLRMLMHEASIYTKLDSSHLALEISKQSVDIYEKAISEGVDIRMLDYVNAIFGIANSYISLEITDSIIPYANKGLDLARLLNFEDHENVFLLFLAKADTEDGKFQEAISQLNYLVPRLRDNQGLYGAVIENLIKCHLGVDEEERALKWLKELELEIAKDPGSKSYLKNTYNNIFQYYHDLGDHEQALAFKFKEDEINKILDKEWNELENDIITTTDNLTDTSNKFNPNYLYLIFVLVTSGIVLFIYKNRRDPKKKKEPSKEIDISKSNEILAYLDQFEKNKDYLIATTLSGLAKASSTNTTYLSKVINEHKKQNFNKYINELRIIHFLDDVDSDFNKYSKLTMSGIANDLGFKSARTFSKAFKEKTGENPSEYLEKKSRL